MILFTVEILACPCGTRCIVPIVGGWGVCQPDKSCSRFNLNPDCNVGKYFSIITSNIMKDNSDIQFENALLFDN